MDNNEPAFPVIGIAPGMTLRDYFAGQVIIALPHMGCGADLDNKDFAAAAYQIADALLAERARHG